MTNGKKDDDFLGESIDDIFDSKFEDSKSGNKSEDKIDSFVNKEKKIVDQGEDEVDSFIIEDGQEDSSENIIQDEDDIYVLEDQGVEVTPLRNIERKNTPPIEQEKKADEADDGFYVLEDPNFDEEPETQQEVNIPEEKQTPPIQDNSSFDIEDDFELLEREFDSVENKDSAPPQPEIKKDDYSENEAKGDFELDLIDEAPIKEEKESLDFENEFVNLKPPEIPESENNDFGEFELERHEYNAEENMEQSRFDTPPPIPKEGNEFVLDSTFENNKTPDTGELESFETDTASKDTFSMESSIDDEIEKKKTDGRFFNADGKPVNDDEILKPEQPQLKRDDFESSQPSAPPAFQKPSSDHGFDMKVKKKSSALLDQKNLMIGGAILVAVIVIVFVIPTFFGDSKKPKKNKIVEPVKKQNVIKKKTPPKKKKKKKLSDREKVNKLFSSAKKSFEEGRLNEALDLCRQAINIKRSDALIFLEREILEKIESIEKAKKIAAIEKKDKDDYDRAIRNDNIASFQKYIKDHPEGKYVSSAKNMIEKLKKRLYAEKLNNIITKARTNRKVRLRSENIEISKSITDMISAKSSIYNDFEIQKIEGDRVLIDYSTGLMWMVANYKMKYAKAKFWAVRHYAGYYNWRLPTAEEVYSLKGIDPSYLSRNSINNFVIWTGDGDTESAQNWIFSLLDGKFSTSSVYNSHNLISVRTIK